MGFDTPIESWLLGLSRDWTKSFLSQSHLRQEGFIGSAILRTTYEDMLMFQLWLVEQ